jgi:seryl-tRNA synthetase
MLDIKLIRDNPEIVRQSLQKRGDESKLQMLEELIQKDVLWRQSQEKANSLKAERNLLSRKIAETKRAGGDASELLKRSAEIPRDITALDQETLTLRGEIDGMLMRLPNVLHDSVPVGVDDGANVVIKTWGKPKKFDFGLKSHGELAESLGLADFDRATRIAGAGFNYLKGDLALLDMALVKYAIDFLVVKNYTFIEPPFMMRRAPYEGVTDLGDFEQVMYKIEDEDLYLIATSEHPMAAMFMDEIIDEDSLPIKLVGYSPCFRREIGAHGVDTKGLFRMHQFNKVEQFIFCKPEDSWSYHEELQANTEAIFLPGRERLHRRHRQSGRQEVRHRSLVPEAGQVWRSYVMLQLHRLPGQAAQYQMRQTRFRQEKRASYAQQYGHSDLQSHGGHP